MPPDELQVRCDREITAAVDSDNTIFPERGKLPAQFSLVFAILMFLYAQFGFTNWLIAVLAGLFVIGIVSATFDEIRIRKRRRTLDGLLPSRTKTR